MKFTKHCLLAALSACCVVACEDGSNVISESADAAANGNVDGGGAMTDGDASVAPLPPGSPALQAPYIAPAEPMAFFGLRVEPKEIVMPEGASIRLRVYAFKEGRAVEVSSEATLSSDLPFLQISSGLNVLGKAKGEGEIRIEHGNALAKVRVTITDRRVKSLAVDPGSFHLQRNERRALRAYAEYSDGLTEDVTALAGWQSADDLVAKFSIGLGLSNVLEGREVGNTTVTAAFSGVTSTAEVNVVSEAPPVLRVPTREFRGKLLEGFDIATELVYADGRTEQVNVDWASSDRAVGYAISGKAVCVGVGTTQLWATAGGQATFVTLICEAAASTSRVLSVSVFPEAKTLSVGEGFALDGWITREDGTEEKLRAMRADVIPASLATFTPSSGTQSAMVVARTIGKGVVRVYEGGVAVEVVLSVVKGNLQ
jgi:hypothetical protein